MEDMRIHSTVFFFHPLIPTHSFPNKRTHCRRGKKKPPFKLKRHNVCVVFQVLKSKEEPFDKSLEKRDKRKREKNPNNIKKKKKKKKKRIQTFSRM